MPELPEVETYRRYLEASSLHQPIAEMTCEDPKKLLLNDFDEMNAILRGRQFVGTHRVGKHLFVQLDAPQWLYMHFGMTGDLQYFHRDEGAPRHARIVFWFANGYALGFICPRKFERIGLTVDPIGLLTRKNVGFDVLTIPFAVFFKNISRRKAPIKAILLDQSVVAGIGNWIADDVLHRAKVHPETSGHAITEGVARRVFDAMRHVVEQTIEQEANYALLPDDFLIHARGWGKPNAEPVCPNCATPVQHIRVAGRATYYCPWCQPPSLVE